MVFAGFSSGGMAAVCAVDFGDAGNGVDCTRAGFSDGCSVVVCVWAGGTAVGAECAVVCDCCRAGVSGAAGCDGTAPRESERRAESYALGECSCVGWGYGGGDCAECERFRESGDGGAGEISGGGGGLD